ncbi:hypothetical protein FK529_08785 [Tsukamurella asaccharolytica]|uniref:Uncharacterized protein n=1 Tax=Tsukamurella asaccharolytica TaxID=2592067 RepID=A0A5C5RDL9_9ACTN|nr:hypothetical protein [Tsukamurella asaccharolytica]TWS20201.1 hypothetical protein FK529_08785 [Tsukamurella asaccharolytica]
MVNPPGKPGPHGSHASSRARAEKALRLRSMGRTWQEIADTLGFRSRSGAEQAVTRLIKARGPVNLEEDRATSTEMLRVLKSTLSTRFVAAVANGDDDMVLRYAKELRALDGQHSKLNGTAVPETHKHDVTLGRSPDEALAAARDAALAALEARRPLSGGIAVAAPAIEPEPLEAEVVE